MDRVSAPRATSVNCLQVLIKFRSIIASECILKLTESWTPHVSCDLHHYGLHGYLRSLMAMESNVISKVGVILPRSESGNFHNCGLTFQFVMASKWIFKLAGSWDTCTLTNLLDHSLLPNVQICSTPGSNFRLSHGHQVHLQFCSNVEYKFTYCWTPRVNLEMCWMMSCNSISQLLWSQPWNVSESSLDCHLHSHLKLLSNTICNQTRQSLCTWVAI